MACNTIPFEPKNPYKEFIKHKRILPVLIYYLENKGCSQDINKLKETLQKADAVRARFDSYVASRRRKHPPSAVTQIDIDMQPESRSLKRYRK